MGYEKAPVDFTFTEAAKYYLWILPFQAARMLGWMILNSLVFIRNPSVPEKRFINNREGKLSQLGDTNV